MGAAIDAALIENPSTDELVLPAGTFAGNYTVPSGVVLRGANAGSKATAAARTNETILSGSATLVGDAIIDGVTLEAKPIITDATDSFTAKGVRFDGIVVPQGDHAQMATIAPQTPLWNQSIKLDFEDCYFSGTENVYNAFELNFQVADGSVIKGNEFSEAVGSHNVINIYDVEDGGTINITDNHFAKSVNAIRIGVKGDKAVEINIVNNEYDTTDMTSPEWGGLVLIQPYATATTSMKDVVVNINGTVNNTENPQIYYYYAGANDAALGYDNKPKIYIDGHRVTAEELVDRSPNPTP